ncbi:MAG: class I SAM-dependent methyltransferase [Alcaligenaceae bacterium]|nr:class I SAM-dependent methyltransferase [Alcaligenaceae bacterium]
MNFWDQQFSSDTFKYGTAPNAFVTEQAVRLDPCSCVLVPGDGEGRNSVWLAEQGHRVLAVDASSVGLSKARKLAAQRQVTIETEHTDLTHWVPSRPYDALVLTYVHLPAECRQAIHRNLAQALRPGGILILEAFNPGQLSRTSGGPKNPELLYPLDLIRHDFNRLLHETYGTECEISLDEGPGHQGLACVTRYIGTRT